MNIYQIECSIPVGGAASIDMGKILCVDLLFTGWINPAEMYINDENLYRLAINHTHRELPILVITRPLESMSREMYEDFTAASKA